MSFAESFRAARWIRSINLILQAVLFLSLCVGLNYLALHYAWRYDLTTHRRHSLSPETLWYIDRLPRQVRLVVTLTDDAENSEIAQAYRDTSALLREYTYASQKNENPQINVQYLDVFLRRREAENWGNPQPDTITAISGDNRRVVTVTDLYRIENQKRTAFQGEQAITEAILDVSSPNKTKIYFTAGHGELQLDDPDKERGLSALHDALRVRNFDARSLNLATERKIPDDAKLIVIAGPQGRFDGFEQELLRRYLFEKAGRVILLLPPGLSATGLEDLLFDWGVLGDDVLIVESDPTGGTEAGDLVLYPTSSDHPITRLLTNNKVAVQFGPSRAMRPDMGRPLDSSLIVTPLVTTSTSAWGETSYRRSEVQYNPGVDIAGRLAVGTASERVTPKGNLPFSVRGGRLVAFGNTDFVTNARFVSLGNINLFLSAVNWTVDREAQLNVPPRPIDRYKLSLSQQELVRLRYSLLLGVPGVVLLFGLIVYWTRRS